jgi:hypothetical protein
MVHSDAVYIEMPTDLRTNSGPSLSRGEAPVLANDAPVKRKGIIRLTVDIPGSHRSQVGNNRPPARWKSPEFIFYGVAFLFVVPLMVKVPVDLSKGQNDSPFLRK